MNEAGESPAPQGAKSGLIRLLHLEDDPRDAELIRLRLQADGLPCGIEWVNGRQVFESALERQDLDLVLCDYKVPGYGGMAALSQVRAKRPELPVIMISGGLSEEEAVDCVKAGATDYVLKQRLQRLGTAVRRALVEKEERAALQRAEEDLRALAADLEARVRQRTAELETTNRFLDSVIENIPHLVVVKDAHDLRIVRVNRAVEELLGLSQAELLGRATHELFSAREADFLVSKDRESLSRGEPLDVAEARISTRSKGERILKVKKIPILGESGRPQYLLGIAEDVTELKNKERDIQGLNEALVRRSTEVEAANRAKSTFLATMSHEIRTPMNGMLGMLELLGLGELDVEQRETLELVQESSKSLLRIIDDILDFSKIEAGKLEVRPESVSIKQVIEDVQNIYSGNASSKGLVVRRIVDPGISAALMVDPVRLRQILNNFVSNAIKFTSAGWIEIRVQCVERAAGRESLRFSVADTGIGISQEDQQRLFQPFSQAGTDPTQRAGGAGLGLAICRQLAQMMGGSVEMASAPGQGTTMTLNLSLPVAEPTRPSAPGAETTRDRPGPAMVFRIPPSNAEAQAEGTLILLVDDHPINRRLLVRQVRTLGYAADSAEDGAEALEKWNSGRFGLVLTDCHMPRMDGYELARSIRGLESAGGLPRIPIIACTANALQGEAETCLAAGMDDYLVKPVELSQLLEKLGRWLPLPEAAMAPHPASGPSADATSSGEPFDRALIAASWGGDAAMVDEILKSFQGTCDEDAARLRQAVAAGDIPQVTHFAHRIRGASKMVGAVGLAAACEKIDNAGRAGDREAVLAGIPAFEQEWMRLSAHFNSR
ncbi:MAG: response regulator [Burkholderiales bacterium]|nr:response regulator [Burkholderiales bacterium]